MRTIEYTSQFKKDFKRESKGRYRATFAQMLQETLDLFKFNPLHRVNCGFSSQMA